MAAQRWDAARIDATVTRHFTESLGSEDRCRLDMTAFAEPELALASYGERIRTRAPRLFLMLADLGLAEQIFGLVNDGWVDDHLPLPTVEDVRKLGLAPARADGKVERDFFDRQFHYLLRPLVRGEHRTYNGPEIVPIEVGDRPPFLTSRGQLVDQVRIPSQPGTLFCRRRFPLGNGRGLFSESQLLEEIDEIRGLQHDHVVSYWASYTHDGSLYVLFSPVSDFSLKSFLSAPPASYKSLGKTARRELILNWILCLADTVASLHARNRSHGCIKPSTVLFTRRNHVLFADSTRLSPESWLGRAETQSFDRERYDYAAPEQWFRPASGPTSPKRPVLPLSSSPEASASFSIIGSSDRNPSSPSAMLQTPNPHLNPQQADIFSLGCVILELLTCLAKRQTRSFATYRSQRRKTPGRGGAVMDTSFHKNLGQVEGWMAELAKSAKKLAADTDEGARVFRGVTPVLHIVTQMLSVNPSDRPPASEVQQRIYRVVTETCGISEPHCVHQYYPGRPPTSVPAPAPGSDRWQRIASPAGGGAPRTMPPLTRPASFGSRGPDSAGAAAALSHRPRSPRAPAPAPAERTGSSGGNSLGGMSTSTVASSTDTSRTTDAEMEIRTEMPFSMEFADVQKS